MLTTLTRLSPLRAQTLCLLLWLATGWVGLPVANAEPLRVVTEEFSPYNMTENGKITGLSTEVVQAVLAEVGETAPIQVMPWARAYDMALHEENVLIYSITRSPEREPLFNWVGLIVSTHTCLYSSAARPVHLNSLEDARRYQIGTVKDDVGEEYLTARHFTVGENLQSSSKYELNYDKLKGGRVDLWISDDRNAAYLARQAGDQPERVLVQSLPLADLGEDLSLAFSLKTPQATVERYRAALEAIHRNGKYDAIMRKWL
ncbi:transporter substrate-binding domain-containing protein [Pseudomonas sp. HR96]|uniref:substrate-binding periplasmic protein n=1 Tax=Pseudomonas sp. HR96 TaxID=1027966 RepID=UPI002A74DEE3|nr:transporter substrate-binding domain-containing protein [Pseudomonas sp. HR96]WPP01900.1 transporter substrate-binding domain-containing protein [Pseudomonas sp. HR96]